MPRDYQFSAHTASLLLQGSGPHGGKPLWIKCGAELLSAVGAKEPCTDQLMGEAGHNRSHPDTDDQTACASAHIKSALGDAKIAAVHDADGGCRLLATLSILPRRSTRSLRIVNFDPNDEPPQPYSL